MVVKIEIERGITYVADKEGLEWYDLTEDYIRFEDPNYSMELELHKSEIELFIKHRPNSVSRDKNFIKSRSNHINDIELDIICKFLIEQYTKRKYKTVSELVSSKTRVVNKRKMLFNDYSTDELIRFINDKKKQKGETVCQS